MSGASSTPVKVPPSAANHSAATLDPELRSQINTLLLKEGHVTKIQEHLLHSLNANQANWPTLIQNHALNLLRNGEVTTFPALLRRVLDDVRQDTLNPPAPSTASPSTSKTNGTTDKDKKTNGASSTPTPAAGTNLAMDESTSHMCSCGDGCQCVGCAAHPYNDATQDYVRSAWNSMMEDGYAATNGGTNGTHGANGHSEATTNGAGVRGVEKHTNGESGGSPPAPQTPSDAASGLSEEQALSASDFFFVTYPFDGDGCAGETSSCPCGDDCQCLGCTIHNNPLPES